MNFKAIIFAAACVASVSANYDGYVKKETTTTTTTVATSTVAPVVDYKKQEEKLPTTSSVAAVATGKPIDDYNNYKPDAPKTDKAPVVEYEKKETTTVAPPKVEYGTVAPLPTTTPVYSAKSKTAANYYDSAAASNTAGFAAVAGAVVV
ncbi:hypothetical protein HDU67_003429, partial [Dinochytrium kinnereticum]